MNVRTVPTDEERHNTLLSVEPLSKKSISGERLNVSTVPAGEKRHNTSLSMEPWSKKLNVSPVPTKEKKQNTSLSEEPRSKKSKPNERLNVSTVHTDEDKNQKQMVKLTACKLEDNPVKRRYKRKQETRAQTNNITNYFSRTRMIKDKDKPVPKNEYAQAHLPKIEADPNENTELGLAGRDNNLLASEINTSQALSNSKESDLTIKLSLTNNLLEDSEDQVTC